VSGDLPESLLNGLAEVGDVRRLDVLPGDLFVLGLSQYPSEAEIEHLHEQWRSVAGDARLLVLTPGMELTVYRPVEPAKVPAPAEFRWHYGPTDWDPDPGKAWHYDCPSGRGEVLVFEEGASCRGCGADDAPKEGE
jgi:hypothetical protein